MSAPMVRAILDGRKTVTRRVVKPMPGEQSQWLTPEGIGRVPHGEMKAGGWQMHHPKAGTRSEWAPGEFIDIAHDSPLGWIRCPYGEPGDRLWVRETHAIVPCSAYWHDDTIPHRVHVDDQGDKWWSVYREGWERSAPSHWRPSIHMSRWASRITLEIVDVRVERLHEINHDAAVAEGVERFGGGWRDYLRDGDGFISSVPSFLTLWVSINGPGSWAANPFVWVVNFRRIQ